MINEELNEKEIQKAHNAGKYVITGNLEDCIKLNNSIKCVLNV